MSNGTGTTQRWLTGNKWDGGAMLERDAEGWWLVVFERGGDAAAAISIPTYRAVAVADAFGIDKLDLFGAE